MQNKKPLKQLLIIGARGWGREVYNAISKTKEVKSGDLIIKGFLDSKSDAFDGLRGCYPPIICAPEDYEIQPDDVFFVAMGDPHWRKHYAEMIENKGGRFYTYISPDAHIVETAEIGDGSFISGWTCVSDNVTLGRHVVLHSFVIVGHNAVVKDFGTLLSYAFLGGETEMGECSEMNPKSMIVPHRRIGNNVIVGAASVVMRNIGDDVSVFGNPAVKLKI